MAYFQEQQHHLPEDTQENFSVTTVCAQANDTKQRPPKYKSEVLMPEPTDLFPNDQVNLCQHVTYFRDFLVMNNAVFSNSHYINNLLVLFQVMSHPKLLMKQLELLYLEHKKHSLPNHKCVFCFTWALQNTTISTHLPVLVTLFTLKTCHSMQATQNLIFWHMTPHNLADTR